MGECKSCGRTMMLQARGLCRTCYRHQRFIENPAYAESRRAREREAKYQRRLADQEWAEAERARDRARVRSYSGSCELCRDPGIVARGLCRRCYSRIYRRARRAADPAYDVAQAARAAKHIEENSAAIGLAKDSPCADCGMRFPRECMDFDHVHGEKLFSLSKAASRPLATVMAEIAKCDLVCANCHRVRSKSRARERKKTP